MRLLLPALALASALAPTTRTTAPPLQLFVSTAGDDAASGGLASPFRTVRRAQAAVVRAVVAAGSAAGSIAVNLRGGTYSVTWAEPFCLNCSPTENATNSFVGNRESCSATAHKSDDGELWMVGGFGTCGAGPTAPRSGTPEKEMAELRSFATLSFCTSPEDAVHAHSMRPGMYSFLHLGLVTNSSGERIWNIQCENGGCGSDAPPGRKSGLLDGWEGELSAAIQGIGAALRNGTVQGIFLGDEMMSAVKIPPHNWSAVATKAKALMQPFGGGLVYGNIVKW